MHVPEEQPIMCCTHRREQEASQDDTDSKVDSQELSSRLYTAWEAEHEAREEFSG